MRCIISKPQANPMQSGKARLRGWSLSLSTQDGNYIDPLMGWTGTNETRSELTLHFNDLESAKAYADSQNWTYAVEPTLDLRPPLKPKSYADNFLSSRLR